MKKLYLFISLLVIASCISKKEITINNSLIDIIPEDLEFEKEDNLYYKIKTVLLHKETELFFKKPRKHVMNL